MITSLPWGYPEMDRMLKNAPVRIGIVGIGRAGWGMHCEELRGKEPMFEIVAACDLIEERRRKMAERFGCSTYSRIEDLIADPQVELVDIATMSCDHFAHAKMALEAGKDVFLEKPMCTNCEDAQALVDIAASSNGKLYIRHNRRFEPGFQHIKEIIASGILGDVFEIKLRRVSFQRRDDWQTLKELGGGQLLNWGPHIIDHALRFLESPMKSMWSDLKLVAAAGDAEDHLKIILTGENGRMVDLEISGGAAIGEPVYLIWGTRGALSCDDQSITLRYLDPDQQLSKRVADPGTPGTDSFGAPETLSWIEKTISIGPKEKVDMTSIWDALYRSIRNGEPFPIKLEEAVEVMKVISDARAASGSLSVGNR